MSKTNIAAKPVETGNAPTGDGQAPAQGTGASGSGAPAPEGSPGKDKKPRMKKIRKANPTKVRVKLPPIESYEKELEFSAEGPGRVVVRLERLMGTDRVRILDTKYMTTLLERLEEEDKHAWVKRTRKRKNDERNRFRQLAIEGLMEPDPDMQDLYNHPVFRVNRILNRLAKLDTDIGMTPPTRLPAMTPMEPLVDGDEQGHIFKTFPGHANARSQNDEEMDGEDGDMETVFLSRDAFNNNEDEEYSDSQLGGRYNRLQSDPASRRRRDEWDGEGTDYSGENSGEMSREGSFMEAKRMYGVASHEDLEEIWKPFRSHLIDLLFDEEANGSWEMYEIAKEVLGAYQREVETADEFCVKLNRLLN